MSQDRVTRITHFSRMSASYWVDGEYAWSLGLKMVSEAVEKFCLLHRTAAQRGRKQANRRILEVSRRYRVDDQFSERALGNQTNE